jgi:hypothetical protein
MTISTVRGPLDAAAPSLFSQFIRVIVTLCYEVINIMDNSSSALFILVNYIIVCGSVMCANAPTWSTLEARRVQDRGMSEVLQGVPR